VLLEANRTEEAAQAIGKAQQIDPENEYAWVARGDLLNKTGRHEEAIRAYDEAIEALSSSQSLRATAISSRAWYNKGNALMALGNEDEAKEAFNKARELGFKG
jgi:tetratricopeptide (TPR) repeat protein